MEVIIDAHGMIARGIWMDNAVILHGNPSIGQRAFPSRKTLARLRTSWVVTTGL
jgi:hypothetical protein